MFSVLHIFLQITDSGCDRITTTEIVYNPVEGGPSVSVFTNLTSHNFTGLAEACYEFTLKLTNNQDLTSSSLKTFCVGGGKL